MPHFPSDSSTKSAAPPVDVAAARIAARQFGVLTARQLEACGMKPGAVAHRVSTGRLQRVWRGVYAFGHRELRPEGQLLGAVFACGDGAVLSHRAAAHRWGMLTSTRTLIDVTVVTRAGRRQQAGIDLHCVRRLDPQDVTKLHGLPITTPARTLVDLCAVTPDRVVERALDQAYVLRLLKVGELEEAIERARGRNTRALRRLLAAERRTATLTRSELEERFLALVRRGGLPEPEVNARLHGYEVDFLWRKQKRVIEVDGYAFHSVRGTFERDRRKDVDLELAGFSVTRFTRNQVVLEPHDTLERTRRLLLGQ